MAPFSLSQENVQTSRGRLGSGEEAGTPATASKTDLFSATGANLEHQALELMANLDQLVTQLGNPVQPPSRAQAMAFLTTITNDIAAFAELWPIDPRPLSLPALVNIAPCNYSQLHPAHLSDGRLNPPILTKLAIHPTIFRGLSNDLLRVINIYLNMFAIAFEATASKEQWLKRFKGFTIDLAITMHHLQADKSIHGT